MTPEEFKAEIIQAFEEYSTDEGHKMADAVMCDLLRSLGYGEGVDAFNEADKWYS